MGEFSGSRFRSWDRAPRDTHRSVRSPFPFLVVPRGQTDDVAVEQLIVAVFSHDPKLLFPALPWMLERTNDQIILLHGDLNLAAEAKLFEEQFGDPNPLRVPNLDNAGFDHSIHTSPELHLR